MALTEDELDEVCDRLRRKFGAGMFSAAGTSRKDQARIIQKSFEFVKKRGGGEAVTPGSRKAYCCT